MRRHNAGFILLEAGVSLFMACIVMMFLAASYKGILSMMIKHNEQKDGLELAQLEMAKLVTSSQLEGESSWQTEKFAVSTKVMKCAELEGVNRLEVVICEKGKNIPLINLVRYE